MMDNITFGSVVGKSLKEIMKKMYDQYLPYGAWNPVDDRLPKDKGWYLVSIDPRYMPPTGVELVDIFGWDGEKWITVDACLEGFKIIVKDECPVIAWMPLPKPYLIWDTKTNQCVKPSPNTFV